jgi:hypothetical protein
MIPAARLSVIRPDRDKGDPIPFEKRSARAAKTRFVKWELQRRKIVVG